MLHTLQDPQCKVEAYRFNKLPRYLCVESTAVLKRMIDKTFTARYSRRRQTHVDDIDQSPGDHGPMLDLELIQLILVEILAEYHTNHIEHDVEIAMA